MLNKDKLLLNPTELTGILGKNEIEKLSKVLEEKAWKNYREKYDLAKSQIDAISINPS